MTPPAPASRGLFRRSALGGLLLLAACAGGDPDWEPKTLSVDSVRHEHRVYFATDSAALSAREQQRLLAFVREVGPEERAVIRLDGHADERYTDAYNLALSARRNESVAAFLREHGLNHAPIERTAFGKRVPAVPESTPEAWAANRRVEVATERHGVVPPDCPDWGDPRDPNFANRPLPNLGCATATNLGLMVAEPGDLIRGRELAPADGVREAEAVVRYRQDKVKDLIEIRGVR